MSQNITQIEECQCVFSTHHLGSKMHPSMCLAPPRYSGGCNSGKLYQSLSIVFEKLQRSELILISLKSIYARVFTQILIVLNSFQLGFHSSRNSGSLSRWILFTVVQCIPPLRLWSWLNISSIRLPKITGLISFQSNLHRNTQNKSSSLRILQIL